MRKYLFFFVCIFTLTPIHAEEITAFQIGKQIEILPEYEKLDNEGLTGFSRYTTKAPKIFDDVQLLVRDKDSTLVGLVFFKLYDATPSTISTVRKDVLFIVNLLKPNLIERFGEFEDSPKFNQLLNSQDEMYSWGKAFNASLVNKNTNNPAISSVLFNLQAPDFNKDNNYEKRITLALAYTTDAMDKAGQELKGKMAEGF